MQTQIAVLCKEIDKYCSSRITFYVATRNATERDLQAFSFRSRFNPDLTYYAVDITDVSGISNKDLVAYAIDKDFTDEYFVKL